jgi:hypothetical protein
MIIPVLIAVVIYVILTVDVVTNNKTQVSHMGYKTEYFHVSDGDSKEMFNYMKNDGMSQEKLKEFIMLEDRFLEVENGAVCKGVARSYEGLAISDKIKTTFVGYDFSYHTKHLKQISEPTKLINRNITC